MIRKLIFMCQVLLDTDMIDMMTKREIELLISSSHCDGYRP